MWREEPSNPADYNEGVSEANQSPPEEQVPTPVADDTVPLLKPPSCGVMSGVIGKDAELAVCFYCGLLCRPGRRVFGTTAVEAVREMRFRVFCATQLTCSAGIAPNSLLAKIASDLDKPNGQFVVDPTANGVNKFIRDLPIRKVPGIGHVTECRLRAFNVQTINDLYTRRGILYHLVSPTSLKYFMRISLGYSEDEWVSATDDDPCAQPACQKSMGIERTFSDCDDTGELMTRCKQLCSALSSDMRDAHVQGKTVTLKLKLDNFENRSRSQTLPDFTCSPSVIFQCAADLLKEEMTSGDTGPSSSHNCTHPLTLRLMGVRMSNLVPSEMCGPVRQVTLESAFNLVFGKTPHRFSALSTGLEKPLTSSDQTDLDTEFAFPRQTRGAAEQNVTNKMPSTSIPSQMPADDFVPSTNCPVCSRSLKLKNSFEINAHLDTCLSRDMVLKAVRETLVTPSPRVQPGAKRLCSGHTLPKSAFGHGPLDKYFKTT